MTPEYLTRDAAREHLGLGPADVDAAFRDLPTARHGRRVYVRARDLREWIEARFQIDGHALSTLRKAGAA